MMKKLLIMLMIVAMASFLFVGCFTEPDEPIEPDEPVVEICPVVEVASEVEIGGKNYIKKGKQEITVTFAVPTDPVSVYVGASLRGTLEELLRKEVVMYPNEDKTVYIGDFAFGKKVGGCNEAYIYVETCETCDYCKYPYTVDTVGPYASIEITEVICTCPDESYLKFDSDWIGEGNGCEPPDDGCCGDACSGLASWTVDIYDRDPSDDYAGCCAKLLYSGEGTACPILWVTDCTDEWFVEKFYVTIKLKDKVGNSTKYYAKLVFDTDELIRVKEWKDDRWELVEDGIIGDCP